MTRQTRVSNANMMTLGERLGRFSWAMFVPMCLVLIVSEFILYSAGGGAWKPFALSQLFKILFGFGVFAIAAFTNIKLWIKSAYIIYAIALILIILVTFVGHTGMGAQRWLNIGFIHIQPSEMFKIALVIALARYFAWMNSVDLSKFKNYIAPALMMLVPFGLIVIQPDLGTALSIAMITIGMFYIVGANKKWFIIGAILALMAAPVVWFGGMHQYQRDRVITFINPDRDARGAGYQINQAKIAFGSGGLIGKGYMKGSQSQQSFLPEKQTDFIFTMLGEEFGFFGAFLYWCFTLLLLRFYFGWRKHAVTDLDNWCVLVLC